jgi:hypothetical protein
MHIPSITMNKVSSFFVFFSFIKNYSKHKKIIGIKLATLESVFQYEFNDTKYVQYNQDFIEFFMKLHLKMHMCLIHRNICTICVDMKVNMIMLILNSRKLDDHQHGEKEEK